MSEVGRRSSAQNFSNLECPESAAKVSERLIMGRSHSCILTPKCVISTETHVFPKEDPDVRRVVLFLGGAHPQMWRCDATRAGDGDASQGRRQSLRLTCRVIVEGSIWGTPRIEIQEFPGGAKGYSFPTNGVY
jgi:hypothetical protein